MWEDLRSRRQTDFEISENSVARYLVREGNYTHLGDSFKPMLALFARESRE